MLAGHRWKGRGEIQWTACADFLAHEPSPPASGGPMAPVAARMISRVWSSMRVVSASRTAAGTCAPPPCGHTLCITLMRRRVFFGNIIVMPFRGPPPPIFGRPRPGLFSSMLGHWRRALGRDFIRIIWGPERRATMVLTKKTGKDLSPRRIRNPLGRVSGRFRAWPPDQRCDDGVSARTGTGTGSPAAAESTRLSQADWAHFFPSAAWRRWSFQAA